MKIISCFVIVLSFILISLISCKKEGFISSSDASIYITKDTVKFDTVFTTIGSITQSFKIINTNNQKLLLSKIRLMGGVNSSFKININGSNTTELNDVEIDSNDSIYIFVSVNINPNNSNLLFLINDSISIQYNGKERLVQLQAYGQNAHFLSNEIIENDTTWNNDIPYVILGSLQIKNNATLTLNEGCKLYFHADAPLLVNGSLIVNGIKNNEVVFSGDRTDEYYKDLPGSWPGIYFQPSSKNNVFNYAIIKNATDALVVDSNSINTQPKLILHQCIINNALHSGILSKGSSVDLDNTLISNCGENINIQKGGFYHFNNCTVVGYSNTYISHQYPVLQLANHSDNNATLISYDVFADFKNCIFWGDGGGFDEEINFSKEGAGIFDVSLRNCLIKSNIDNSITQLSNVIRNTDPLFDSVDTYNNHYNFNINASFSPAVDAGIDSTTIAVPYDLNKNSRIAGTKTDIGCYEKQN